MQFVYKLSINELVGCIILVGFDMTGCNSALNISMNSCVPLFSDPCLNHYKQMYLFLN